MANSNGSLSDTRVDRLDEITILDFAAFIPPTMNWAEHASAEGMGVICLGAKQGGSPVGLLIAIGQPGQSGIELRWLFVPKSSRKRGIARRLVDALAEEGRRIDADFLVGNWLEGEQASTIQATLRGSGWGEPVEYAKTYHTNTDFHTDGFIDRLSNSKPRLKERVASRSNWRFEEWGALDQSYIRAALDRARIEGWGSSDLETYPFLVPSLSFAAIDEDEQMIGWLLAQEISPRVLTIPSSYVDPKRAGMAGIYTLWHEFRIRAIARYGTDFSVTFSVRSSRQGYQRMLSKRWVRFLDRRIEWRSTLEL